MDSYRDNPPTGQVVSPVRPGDCREQYPKRDSFFSTRFTRLLTHCYAAQDIGTDGAWLLTIIANMEDRTFYRRPVSYFDSQLLLTLGVKSQVTLSNTRRKVIDAGWLHYEHGRKGVPGKYWVKIPAHAEGIADSPTDDSGFTSNFDEQSVSNEFESNEEAVRNEFETDEQSVSNAPPSIPIPKDTNPKDTNPNPKRERSRKPVDVDLVIPQELQELADQWNQLPSGIAPRVMKLHSKTILAGWKKVQADPEAAEYFENVPGLMLAIKGALFAHGTTWFDFEWLFGKRRDRVTWNVSRIVGGKLSETYGNDRTAKKASNGPSNTRYQEPDASMFEDIE